ncbi:MAG: outer membrane lipid asymmetry maintenance protein MlaD [Thermodesulfovibrionales bacterium]|nr:outer membrane lipid asymmetry maintenance protein MlaD [Thermodesulfovibrionales bacterium]
MKKFDLEFAVGLFVLAGFLSLVYLSIQLGGLELVGTNYYIITAEFEKAGGIKPGATVEIAGVEVGKVKKVSLKNYQAVVYMSIKKDVQIQEDAIASIKTKGIIGEKYIQITPGGSEKILAEGGKIRETESALDLEELLSKYIFGKI